MVLGGLVKVQSYGTLLKGLFDRAKSEFDFSRMEFVFGNQGWFSEIGVCLENQVLFSKIGICFFKIGNCSKKAEFAFGFRSFLYFSRLCAVA